MFSSRKRPAVLACGLAAALVVATPGAYGAGDGGGGGGGGGGGADTGSLYSDLVIAYRDGDGTPLLKEYLVDSDEDGTGDTPEYCVQPASLERVPGVTSTVDPLTGRDLWVIPLQGEWIGSADPLPVEEIEPCDPQPQYAMFVAETELERLNLSRTTDEVLARKIKDVATKLQLAEGDVSLDPAGRIAVSGEALDAAPEYAGIYQSLMTTGTIPGLPDTMTGPPAAIPAGAAGTFDAYELGAVAIGTAAGKYVPITVDTVQYYNRTVGFTMTDPLPSWPGQFPFISSADPDATTPMPIDVLPGGEDFVDYSEFSYNRSETFIGSVSWLDVQALEWVVSPILTTVGFTDITQQPVGDRTLTGLTAFAQMADDVRSVIVYLHEHEVVLPGFYMDPVGVDTTAAQEAAITDPAVDVSTPADVFATLPFQVTASLFNPWGGTLVDEGRLRVTLDAPAALASDDVTVSAMVDGTVVPVSFTANGEGDLVGWWGPEAGSEMPAGFHESTNFDVTVSDGAPAGDYQVELELVDVDEPGTALATDVESMSVHSNTLSVLWGSEISPLATQGAYIPLPVRVYAPVGGTGAELTFTLTGPDDDQLTPVVEELAAGDAKIYLDDGTDMVAMPLSLNESGQLVGSRTALVAAGLNDLTWYLTVGEGAPVGSYVIDVGINNGADLAEPVFVTLAAPDSHGQQPPDVGEDTTAPVVSLSVDGILAGTASITIAVNEPVSSMQCRLTTDGVAAAWEDCAAGGKTYVDLEPGDYSVAVKATDLADNTATYLITFTVSGPATISPELTLANNSLGNDVVRVNAPAAAVGATVRVFKVRTDGSVIRPALASSTANAYGNARFVVKDLKKLSYTTYQAVVGATEATLKAWTPQRRIR